MLDFQTKFIISTPVGGAEPGPRFAMFQSFFTSPAFGGLLSDGFLGHSYPPSRGNFFINAPSFLLSETRSPYILTKLALVAPQTRLPRLRSGNGDEGPVAAGAHEVNK